MYNLDAKSSGYLPYVVETGSFARPIWFLKIGCSAKNGLLFCSTAFASRSLAQHEPNLGSIEGNVYLVKGVVTFHVGKGVNTNSCVVRHLTLPMYFIVFLH